MITEDLIDINQCCGCELCSHVCPTKSISFTTGNLGGLYPFINETTCIDCKLCVKKCPINIKSADDYSVIKSYAAVNTDKHELFQSTSGGVF